MASSRRSSRHTIEVELGGNNPVNPTNGENTPSSTNSTENTSCFKKLPNLSSRTVMVGSLVLGVLLLLVVTLTIIFTRNYVNPHSQTGTAAAVTDTDVVKSRAFKSRSTLTLDTGNGTGGGDGNIQIALTQRTITSPDPVPFHNIGEVGRGYNLLYGNPHSTDGADPGVKAPVFSMATMYPNGSLLPNARISDDGRFLLPAGVDVFQDVSCRLDWSTTMVSSGSSYRSSLESSVSASVEANYIFYSASFSMSRDYKEVLAATQSGSSTYAKSSAECSLYTAYIRTSPNDNHPNLSPSFDAHVRSLAYGDISDIDAAVDEFISIYGTHVPTRVVMGARYGQQSELASRAASSQVESDLKQKAKLSVMSSLNAEGLSDEQLKTASDFTQSCYSQRLFTMGSTPTQDMQGSTWAAQGINDPAPIQQHGLIPLDTLITPQWFPGADGLMGLKAKIRERLESYCTIQTGGSPDCLLTGSVHQDRCVGGWIYVNEGRTTIFNPVTGGNQCPTGYSFLSGFDEQKQELLPFLPICVSSRTDVDECKLYVRYGNNTGITSFGGFYTVDKPDNGACVYRSATVGAPISPNPGCTCPNGYYPYKSNSLSYVCLLRGGHLFGRTFGGMFAPRDGVSNDYIMSEADLKKVTFETKIYDCPIGYKVAPFLSPGDYICVLDANPLFSNIRPVEVVLPNATDSSNTSNTSTNAIHQQQHTMGVHKLNTLQHTIEAHIDGAGDEPFQMIHTLDDGDDAAAEHNNNETSPSPLDSLDDLRDSLDDDGGAPFNETAAYDECQEEFEKRQHASIPRQCFRRLSRKLGESLKDIENKRHHIIHLGRNNYHLDEWGRVTGFTCDEHCTQKGQGRYGSHPGRMITFLRRFFGGIKIVADPDQAGHLLAPRLGISEALWNDPAYSAVENVYAKYYNNDPLNFVPLIRSVNGKRGTYYLDLDNWGNAEEYAHNQLETGCEVAIEAKLYYRKPDIKRGKFDLEDYRPTTWRYRVISKNPKKKKLDCKTVLYQGDNS